MKTLTSVLLTAVSLLCWLPAQAPAAEGRSAAGAARCFELRTYTAAPGKLDALNARFRDHTCRLFRKHGMEIVGFWTPAEGEPGAGRTLIYLLAPPSREAARKSWDAFRNDPDWQKARAESETNGRLVEKVESVYLVATDYSPQR